MSVRELEKNAKNYYEKKYIEPIQYVLKTENIFPLDFNDDSIRGTDEKKSIEYFDNLVVHPDRVIRQELFTNYHKPVKADLKK